MGKSATHSLQELLTIGEPAHLGPEPRSGTLSQSDLEARLTPLLDSAKTPTERRQLIRALILLWHDHLDAAHSLTQEIENPDGSFIHAIIHRREPDAWNSKYWFRRVGAHPAFPEIARQVSTLLTQKGNSALSTKLLPGGHWDPMAFIDACDQPGNHEPLLREIQRLESAALLDHLLTPSCP